MTAKIVIVAYDSHDGVGGPFVWLQRMPTLLRERGFDVRIALYYWPGQDPDQGIVYRVLREQQIPVNRTEFADSETNVRWLLGDLRNATPDVLIADNVIPAMLARRFLPKSLATIGILRSDDEFYHGIIDRFIAGAQRDQMSAVVCVSDYLRNIVIERGFDPERVIRIPSGTPIPDQTTTLPDDEFRIAYVGRLAEEQKRISATTQVLIRTVQEVPGTVATIYGDGPDRPNVENLLKRTDAQVSLAGRLSPQELLKELQQTHAIVLLSDYEGTPTAIMEAMACGVVPICFNIRSGIPELITHDETGLLVENRDDAVVSAVRRLKHDPSTYGRLSRLARERVTRGFSVSKSLATWTDLLSSQSRLGKELIRPPRWLSFPPVHQGFAQQDRRRIGFCGRSIARTSRLLMTARRLAGKLRRSLIRND